jgi:MipA family protein
MLRALLFSAVSAAALVAVPAAALAGEGAYWWSGDWYVKAGATAFSSPRYQGGKTSILSLAPLLSVGKSGEAVRFTSRDDSPSFPLYDAGAFRAGLTAKLVMPRNGDDSSDLKGLKSIRLGAEAGVFAETYATDWLRLHGEVRRGIRSHAGIVADFAADAFTDITPTVRLSAGPRVTLGSERYMNAYYGVSASEAVQSGLSRYRPSGGVESAGLGAEINWKATERIETGLFAEYKRLIGPAANSSLVSERGSRNQVLIGVSATYRFDFRLP